MDSLVALKNRMERVLRMRLKERMRQARDLKLYFGPGTIGIHASISPLCKIGISVATDLFEGLGFEERNELFWSLLEGDIQDAEAEQVDFWQMLTLAEAEKVLPGLLKRRRVRKAAPQTTGVLPA